MYDSLDLFRVSSVMARHAGAQQSLVATNVANADTPGYRAMSLPAFSDTHRASSGIGLRMTRLGHMELPDQSGMPRPFAGSGESAPNGNSVSIEEEMLNAIEAQRQHNQALAIYRHAMGLIRTSLGR